MEALIGKIVWVLGVVAWYVIRYPFERRAKRVRIVKHHRPASESIGLAAAFAGLAVIPAIYVATGAPRMADYPASTVAVFLGAVVYIAALWVFRRSHKALGRNWSISLDIREKHRLICDGPYALVRHPMYSSFSLMALGQALLLSNWIAGLSGVVGVALLIGLRIHKEEAMMLGVFGLEYDNYMRRTKRIIPFVY
jgi:protein-S-isoprenylcysteine O-methyltransferase Ste14